MRVSSCCLAAIALASAIAALRLGLWLGGTPGPGLFPFLAALMLLGASIAAFFQSPAHAEDSEPADRRRLVGYAAAISVFAAAFSLLGSIIATFGFLVGVLRAIERLRWSYALAIATTLAVLSWMVFRQLLGVPLPAGLWEVG
jgi:putative tricarboxylic transport membrane protein